MMTGEFATRSTAWLATVGYVATLLIVLTCNGDRAAIWARRIWTSACAVFLVHVAVAFGVYHQWSHVAAWTHTALRTEELIGIRSGAGVWFNYFFALVWVGDCGWWWWVGIERYRSRRRSVTFAVHAWFAFMMFNATIVFGRGLLPWLGGVAAVAILAAAVRRRNRAPLAHHES